MEGTGRRRLYLMRHGHVDYFDTSLKSPRDAMLTDEGRAQVKAAGAALRNIDFDLIAHSNLPRTIATSEIIRAEHRQDAKIARVTPIALEAFEEVKAGWIKAESRETLAAILAFAFDDAAREGARFLPDGETFASAEQRVRAGLGELVSRKDWRTALLVAHEGINRILLGLVCGGGLASIGSFEQDLGCINVIDIDVVPGLDGKLSVERMLIKAMNVTPYDYLKAGLSRTAIEVLFDMDFGATRPPKHLADGTVETTSP